MIYPLFIFVFLALSIYIAKSPLIKFFIKDALDIIGIHIFDHIYTPTTIIQSPTYTIFNIVFIKYKQKRITVKNIRSKTHIPLTYVLPKHKLEYYIDNKKHTIPYKEGTPYKVKKGELVLYEKVRKRFGYMYVEVMRSDTWPMNHNSEECYS